MSPDIGERRPARDGIRHERAFLPPYTRCQPSVRSAERPPRPGVAPAASPPPRRAAAGAAIARLGLAALAVAACARGPADRVATGGVTVELLEGFDPSLDIRYDDVRSELVLESAAVDLPAHVTHHDVPRPPAQYGTIPIDGWLHGYAVELADADGRPVPRVTLHHVNVISPERRELFSGIMQRIGGAGHETAAVDLPALIGYPVREGERLIMTVMLHNPTDTAYQGVRVRVRMPHSGPKRVIPPVEFFPFYLDVMPPASVHQYDVPPGGLHEKTWQGSPAVSGRLLGISGHLHDHGVAIRLEDLTTGKLLWEARPILNERGSVVGMPQNLFFKRLGIPIHRDHVYRVTAVYENTTDAVIEGAMAAVGGIIAVRRSEAWPAVELTSDDFALDLDLVRTGGDMMQAGAAPSRKTTAAPSGAHSHD